MKKGVIDAETHHGPQGGDEPLVPGVTQSQPDGSDGDQRVRPSPAGGPHSDKSFGVPSPVLPCVERPWAGGRKVLPSADLPRASWCVAWLCWTAVAHLL